MEMSMTLHGNQYEVIFMAYLTKWVETYPVEEQTSKTIKIARLNLVCWPNLLSEPILDVCEILGIKKINTTAYHPQTDRLVEKMNKTLRSMLAKHACPPIWL